MFALLRNTIASALVAAGAACPAQAADTAAGRLRLDAGQPVFDAPADWTLAAHWEDGGRQFAEYRFPLRAAPAGAQAVARIALRQLARSVRYDDLTPDEADALERGSSDAIQEVLGEVERMPGLDFESGGAQLTYTAVEGDKRFHYVQFISVKGAQAQAGEPRPAVAVELRCRSAVDEDAPQHEAAAEELETHCYDVLTGLGEGDDLLQ